MIGFLNRCAFVPTAYSNTDDFAVNVSAPVTGFYAPAACTKPPVVNGATYHYFAESIDKTQHEEGDAVWDTASSTLQRQSGTVRNSSNSGSLVTFSAPPTVHMGGPAASDIGFRGYERFTTGASTVTINPDVFASWVTTDGTGARHIALPQLDEKASGQEHLIIMVSQADPGDTIVCADADHSFTLGQYVGQFVLLRWSGANFIWEIIDGGGTVRTTAGSQGQVWYRSPVGNFELLNVGSIFSDSNFSPFLALQTGDSSGAPDFTERQANDIQTWNAKTTSGSNTNIPGLQGFRYNLRITSGGTAGAEPVTVGTPDITGQRLLVTFTTQTAGGDVISFSTTNIKQGGATPTTVQLNNQGELILLEWWETFWNVIYASAGVVTP